MDAEEISAEQRPPWLQMRAQWRLQEAELKARIVDLETQVREAAELISIGFLWQSQDGDESDKRAAEWLKKYRGQGG